MFKSPKCLFVAIQIWFILFLFNVYIKLLALFLILLMYLFLGISGKSQILFALVYTTRYLDLVTTYVSLYNTFMKFIFLATSYATIYLIYLKFKATYDHNHDTFRIEFLVVPAFALAMLINHDFTFLEVSLQVLLNIHWIFNNK